MSPTQKAAGETFTLTVNGTNFALDPNGARLHFSDSSITAANYVITATQIKADVTVPAAVAASNPATVQVDVVNPDHGQATAPTPLTLNPPPTISSLDPAVAGTNKTFTLHILGNHFNSNATVSSADSSFAVSGVKYISANEIDATVDTNGTSVGAHPVKVDNGDGGTAQHVLNVINPPSAPQGVTVDSGDHGIRVRWSAPASNGGDPVTSYTVTVTKHSDGSAVASYTTPNATTFQRVFFPLTNGVRYDASVVATNHAGNGPAATGNGTPKFATNLSLHRSKHTVSKGQAVTLSGQLLRSDKHGLSGAKVKIYRTLGGHTKRLRTLTTSAGGKWHMTLKPTKTATYHAVFAGDGADAGSVSTSGKVKVRP
ncbi:MAG: fibronectin type III domain-containing protein [Frankiales bacterium]|nr:fibronectin type III domain-containing protein [Frankiales bacterium]